MSNNKEELHKRLSNLWESPETETLDTSGQKYAVISDMHLGNKSKADDFAHNQEITRNALIHYKENDYKLILLGDIEEFWQFDLSEIKHHYDDTIYNLIRSYGDENVIRIFGNHDIDWSIMKDPIRNDQSPGHNPLEALRLKDSAGDARILLIHGHQETLDSDKFSWISRNVVNIYGKTIERIIDFDPAPSMTKSMIVKDYEKDRYEWAKNNKRLIICGHTHRAIFASLSWVEKLKKDLIRLQTEIQKADTSNDRKEELIDEIYRLGRQIQYEEQRGREIDPA